MSSEGSLIILSAPSGSGKTSLADRVVAELAGLRFSVSHTTRPMRFGEEEGADYFFVGTDQFEEMVRQDRFLEWANVYGNYYGTSRAFVEEQLHQGVDVLLDIDVQGAMKVKQLVPDAVMVFVLPPSYEVLEVRLRGRGLDDDAVIRRRLEIARKEIESYKCYDYVIINKDLNQSVANLVSIIQASRCRIGRLGMEAERIVDTFRNA